MQIWRWSQSPRIRLSSRFEAGRRQAPRWAQRAERRFQRIMTGFNRKIALAVAILALFAVETALAQENLDQGKSGAQLYANECAICHKSPAGLTKAGGLLGLDSFLREHYTASRESAAAIAAYLKTVDTGGPAPKPRATSKPKKKEADTKAKPDEAKSDTKDKSDKSAKPSETKSDEKADKEKADKQKSAKEKAAAKKDKKEKAATSKTSEKKPKAKTSEKKTADKTATEKTSDEKKTADKKPANKKLTEKKTSEKKTTEKKKSDDDKPKAD